MQFDIYLMFEGSMGLIKYSLALPNYFEKD